ncbi:MAG: thiamine diphosphokinase [Clostridiales bacterium]|nr:thiamine diphosphokinase [Clostridiales bacterium]
MNNAVCCIFGGAPCEYRSVSLDADAYVIAADAGFKHLEALGIKPDLIMGDFDSLGFVPQGADVIRCKPEKDDTDTMLAVKYALEHGFKELRLYGCCGGRLDHTLANLQTLVFISRSGANGTLFDGSLRITALTNGKMFFDASHEGVISVFCSGDSARGVYLEGLKYPLVNATLTHDMPLGVSNEFTGTQASVSVESGTLLVIWNETERTGA